MSVKYQNSKYIRIADELADSIRRGTLHLDGDKFLTRNELADRYKIGVVTAGKVMKILADSGLIHFSRGQFPKILTGNRMPMERAKSLQGGKKIGILKPLTSYTRSFGAWRSMTINYIQSKIMLDGNTSTWLPMDRPIKEFANEFSGFLMLEPIRMYPDILEQLIESGKPYATVSYDHMRPNTLFFESNFFIQQIFLTFMRLGISNILLLTDSIIPIDSFSNYHKENLMEDFFKFYNYKVSIDHAAIDIDDEPSMNSQLLDIMSRHTSHKTGVITINDFVAEAVNKLIVDENEFTPENFFLISYSAMPYIEMKYSYVDFRFKKTASLLLEILYNQIDNNTNYDIGKILLPELHLKDTMPGMPPLNS